MSRDFVELKFLNKFLPDTLVAVLWWITNWTIGTLLICGMALIAGFAIGGLLKLLVIINNIL